MYFILTQYSCDFVLFLVYPLFSSPLFVCISFYISLFYGQFVLIARKLFFFYIFRDQPNKACMSRLYSLQGSAYFIQETDTMQYTNISKSLLYLVKCQIRQNPGLFSSRRSDSNPVFPQGSYPDPVLNSTRILNAALYYLNAERFFLAVLSEKYAISRNVLSLTRFLKMCQV